MADFLVKETVSDQLLDLATKLCKMPNLEHFNIVGGTALALQIGHRKSTDIDLFCNSLDSSLYNTFDFVSILDNLKDAFKDVNVVSIYKNRTLITYIDGIKVDFVFQRNSKMLEKPLFVQDIRLASLKDIAAMKIMAVATTSNRIKDYVDIYYLLKHFSLETLFNFYIEKYSINSIQTALDNLPYFYDVSQDEFEALDFLVETPSLKEICNVLSQEVKKYSKKIIG